MDSQLRVHTNDFLPQTNNADARNDANYFQQQALHDFEYYMRIPSKHIEYIKPSVPLASFSIQTIIPYRAEEAQANMPEKHAQIYENMYSNLKDERNTLMQQANGLGAGYSRENTKSMVLQKQFIEQALRTKLLQALQKEIQLPQRATFSSLVKNANFEILPTVSQSPLADFQQKTATSTESAAEQLVKAAQQQQQHRQMSTSQTSDNFQNFKSNSNETTEVKNEILGKLPHSSNTTAQNQNRDHDFYQSLSTYLQTYPIKENMTQGRQNMFTAPTPIFEPSQELHAQSIASLPYTPVASSQYSIESYSALPNQETFQQNLPATTFPTLAKTSVSQPNMDQINQIFKDQRTKPIDFRAFSRDIGNRVPQLPNKGSDSFTPFLSQKNQDIATIVSGDRIQEVREEANNQLTAEMPSHLLSELQNDIGTKYAANGGYIYR